MVIVNKGRWTRKPLPTERVEIDWTHPLARGLMRYYLPGPKILELTRGFQVSSEGGAIIAPSPRGVVGHLDGAAGYFSDGNQIPFVDTGSMLFRAIHRFPDFAAAMLIDSDHPAEVNRYLFYRRSNVVPDDYGWFLNGTVIFDSGENNLLIANTPASVALTWDQSLASNKQAVYKDGVLRTNYNVALSNAATPNLRIGARIGTPPGAYWNGQIDYIAFYSRQLKGEEVSALHQEPYAFLRPVIRRTYVVGGTDKTVADAGSGVESLSISVSAAIADSGAGAEILSITAQLAVADIGAGADAVTVDPGDAAKLVSDTGSGADAIATIVAQVAVPDTGGGIETVAIVAALTMADAGAGAEQVVVTAQIPITDLATGLDTLSVLAALGIADTGLGTETISSAIRSIDIQDVAIGSEILTVSATLTLSDAGAAVESVLVDTGLIAAIIRMVGVALAVPKLTGVALAMPKLVDVVLTV